MKPITAKDIQDAVDTKKAELEALLDTGKLAILFPRDESNRTFRTELDTYIGSSETVSIPFLKEFIAKAESEGASEIVIENDSYYDEGCNIKVYYEVVRAINDSEYEAELQQFKANYIRNQVAIVAQELEKQRNEYNQYKRLKAKYENQ